MFSSAEVKTCREAAVVGRNTLEKQNRFISRYFPYCNACLLGISGARQIESSPFPQKTVETAVKEIYARREFAWVHNPYDFSFEEWLLDSLKKLFGWLEKIPPFNADISTPSVMISWWFIFAFFSVALAAILAFIVIRFSAQFAQDVEKREEQKQEDARVATPSSLARQAEEEVLRGDVASAIRHLFHATLLHLERKGLIRHEKSKTNREHVRQLRDTVFSRPFELFTVLFEKIWYGKQGCEKSDFVHAKELYEIIMAQAAQKAKS